MSYQYFYHHVANLPPSVGSRTHALVYPGAVCPQTANFGRIHGTAPAVGRITFKGTVLVPIAQPVTVQIGQSVFYGFAVKGDIDNSIQNGNNTSFSLVDMRDRLHDVNHAAQYNMMDDGGTWWHLSPEFWNLQIPSFIHDLERQQDINTGQELPNYDLNVLANCPPPFSMMTLMKAFAIWYNFTFSWTASAGDKLINHYPENMDFNRPTKVIDCIDEMLSRSNLQFTCWGDLHLHITDRGVPDNQFEEDITSGNINLCNFPYKKAALGSELNTKGRRVVVVGGRNQYENWFPCYPDWNKYFTWHVINPFSPDLAALLIQNDLTELSLLEELPEKFWDCGNYQGRSRMKMTIREYVDKIPFKAYRADFNKPLRQVYKVTDPEDNGVSTHEEPTKEDFEELDDNGQFKKFTWTDKRPPHKTDYTWDSVFPISSKLVTDTARQFLCKGTVRQHYMKGEKDDKAFFLNGVFAYITDGSSIEVEDYILAPPPDPSLQGQFDAARRDKLRKVKSKCEPREGTETTACIKYYRATIYFDRWQLGLAEGIKGPLISSQDEEPTEPYTAEPDHIYALISLDREMYYYILGEDQGNPRVREQVVEHAELKKFFAEFKEVPMLARNYIQDDYISIIFADELSQEIAQRKLNHEYVTTAGHITFRTAAGYMPSGIIESVQVNFSAGTGQEETINFTNIFNDERVPSFFGAVSARDKAKSSETIKRESLIRMAKETLKQIRNQGKIEAHREDKKENFGTIKVSQRFGGIDNAAAVKLTDEETESASTTIEVGEVMVVDSAPEEE